VAAAPAILIATSTFWRNAWRYKERAYRHTYWDLGTTLGNVLAVASAEELQSKVVLGFHDAAINDLLCVDGQREAAVALVPLGFAGTPGPAPAIEPLDHTVEPDSDDEYDFPRIWEMHAASCLASGADAAEWRDRRIRRDPQNVADDDIPLHPITDLDRPRTPVDEAIRRRRSTRHYTRDEAISFESFSTLLERASQPIAFDCLDADARSFTDPYLIINHVEGLEQGRYAFHPESGTIEQLAAGDFRDDASRLAVGQGYPADAHVNVYYLADLDPIFAAYGNRGWRIAQLEGALRAQKMHLAAHTLGLGAVGSTSLDDIVTDFFAPHAAGKGFMFVVVFGKRRRPNPRA
jgi:nitroreductase